MDDKEIDVELIKIHREISNKKADAISAHCRIVITIKMDSAK